MTESTSHSVRISHSLALNRHLDSCAAAMRVSASSWIRSVVTGAPLWPDLTAAESRVAKAIQHAAVAVMRDSRANRRPLDPTVARSLVRLSEFLGEPVEFTPVLVQMIPPIDAIAGDKKLIVPLADVEHARVVAAAKSMGKPVGAWLRSTLASVAIPPSPPTRITQEAATRFDELIAANRWSLLANLAREIVGKPPVYVPVWHDLLPGDARLAWSLDEAGQVQFRAAAGAVA